MVASPRLQQARAPSNLSDSRFNGLQVFCGRGEGPRSWWWWSLALNELCARLQPCPSWRAEQTHNVWKQCGRWSASLIYPYKTNRQTGPLRWGNSLKIKAPGVQSGAWLSETPLHLRRTAATTACLPPWLLTAQTRTKLPKMRSREPLRALPQSWRVAQLYKNLFFNAKKTRE